MYFQKTKKRYTMLMIARCADHRLLRRSGKEILSRIIFATFRTMNVKKARTKMLSFNLNSKKSAEDLIKLCEKYRDDVEVEVIHGNQTVNGCSLLGVFSLIGNFVGINAYSGDENKMQSFEEELEKIKC